MPFVVVGRDNKTQEVSLVSEEVFGTRQDAMKALQKLPKKVARQHKDSEILLLDLDDATPVVLLGEEEAPKEPVEEPAAGEETADGAEEAEGAGLADAIAKATESMESEGITPPESVGPARSKARRLKSPFPELEPEAESGPLVDQVAPEMPLGEPVLEEGAMVAPAEEPVEQAEEPVEAEAQQEAIEQEEAQQQAGPEEAFVEEERPEEGGEPVWPWEGEQSPSGDEDQAEPPGGTLEQTEEAAVEAVEPEAGPAAPAEQEPTEAGDSELASVIDSLEAPRAEEAASVLDEDSLIRALSDEEMLDAGSRAVIMGDYGGDAAPEVPVPPAAEDVGSSEPAPVTGVETAPAGAGLPVDESMKTSAYTCDDCVYENTCPKSHQEDPATCGSFQFRSF